MAKPSIPKYLGPFTSRLRRLFGQSPAVGKRHGRRSRHKDVATAEGHAVPSKRRRRACGRGSGRAGLGPPIYEDASRTTPVMSLAAALCTIVAVTTPGALAFADVRMKALLVPCDNKAYQPTEVRNGLTKCKNKIEVTLLVNNTPGGNKGKSYIHLTEVYEPELERTSRLFNTIVIQHRQEELLLAYPMRYVATVNGKVTEKVVAQDVCDLTVCAGYTQKKKVLKGYCCNCEHGKNCTVHCLKDSPLWYTMSLLGAPVIKQETYVQLFVQKDGATLPYRWHTFPEYPEDLVLSADHPEDANRENTVTASFLSEKAAETALVLKNYKKLRVLVPFPSQRIRVANLPPVYAERQASGEMPSPILLSYFKDKLPESPILFDETSGERFLTFVYEHPHLSVIHLELNADDIVLLRQG
ncbi:hapless 2-like [Dermacentor variabilis]|uniref:hapless 2-like n=1 Tax=Dermacentor variabilis TaxID=34621 RepID=UPI003F5C2FB9